MLLTCVSLWYGISSQVSSEPVSSALDSQEKVQSTKAVQVKNFASIKLVLIGASYMYVLNGAHFFSSINCSDFFSFFLDKPWTFWVHVLVSFENCLIM